MFWTRNKNKILSCFSSPVVFAPDSISKKIPLEIKDYETIIIIGSDSFFNWTINAVYKQIDFKKGQTLQAFIPDRRNSALASNLRLPSTVDEQIDIIKKRQFIYMDLIRCYCINKQGVFDNRLVLNDVLIGIPELRISMIFQRISGFFKNQALKNSDQTSKSIQLISKEELIYEGNYTFSLILLGNKITKGPRLRIKKRRRLPFFRFYQLNSNTIIDLRKTLSNALSTEGNRKNALYLKGDFKELTIKGDGASNSIITDGIHIGRLPASFYLLPKAVRVISPMITIKSRQSIKRKISTAKIAKSVGSRVGIKKS